MSIPRCTTPNAWESLVTAAVGDHIMLHHIMRIPLIGLDQSPGSNYWTSATVNKNLGHHDGGMDGERTGHKTSLVQQAGHFSHQVRVPDVRMCQRVHGPLHWISLTDAKCQSLSDPPKTAAA